jgi:hypothetical protein
VPKIPIFPGRQRSIPTPVRTTAPVRKLQGFSTSFGPRTPRLVSCDGAAIVSPNFWSSLKPIDPGAVRRIHEMTLRNQWEVFFITQRPQTAGDTVQRQTQHWLVKQGFDLPSVLVLPGSRGAAAAALRLDFLVDDSAQNCLDLISDSTARPLLIVPDDDVPIVTSAKRLGIGTARTIGECLDLLEKATAAQRHPGLLHRLSSLVGWR